jgi:uracil phosphoribosyltransferase
MTPLPLQAFANLHVVKHPLVQHKLTYLRKADTKMPLFRQLLTEISLLLGYEVTRHLALQPKTIETPLTTTQGAIVDHNALVMTPVLRAGLGMLEGLLDLMPFAQIGHIGLYRDPETTLPVPYFVRLPAFTHQTFIVLDPMIATGHSAAEAVQTLVNHGVPAENILFLALVVSPEGMTVFNARFPQVPVYAAALDDHLDEHSYIVPGLGDAGDRLFGTL